MNRLPKQQGCRRKESRNFLKNSRLYLSGICFFLSRSKIKKVFRVRKFAFLCSNNLLTIFIFIYQPPAPFGSRQKKGGLS